MENWWFAPLIIGITVIPSMGLIIAGVVVEALHRRKANRCTAVTNGTVIGYRFLGGVNMKPVIGYRVNGRDYRVARQFRAYAGVEKNVPWDPYNDSGAYVSDNDVLHVPTRMVTNLRAMAQQLWPLGSPMPVYYDPADPSKAFAHHVNKRMSMVAIVLCATGAGTLAILLPFTLLVLTQL
ncbi:hypothetical protein CS006_01210 [Bifidobacterium primatium]|uniref:DUF3592 domain-containing protein n=2 Tax=Bifidobacterium TaxID=1678 RepID=A0A2M9HAI0_9BIFI|nr:MULTISPECIES: DUF3592 domain-containing protein [Bifidobacterium]NEG96596.1 DUF3592 domain-containing protein [Bifidobacterium sp. SMB2]NEH12379.1 DUF3592 domain-containing protein [Bifidobacterium saimiriisciurei]PJM73822.1 hypothetical protein CS006_01210 [Bifidobacterium primatium]